MNRPHLLATVLVVCFLAPSVASAQYPSTVKGYRFLPRDSTLTVSHPGLEIPDYLYPVFGTFDIVFTTPPPYGDVWGNSARFTNVHAWAANPLTASAPIDLDQALNLSGLEGHQLPVAAPFDVYRFTGKTTDGSAVSLSVSLPGFNAYLNGGTTPPSDHPYNVAYELNAHARQRPFADFSEDDLIDQNDLAKWSAGFGGAMTGPVDTLSHGDANGDNAVDGADFLAWQRQLGQSTATASTVAVPEPTAIMLCIAAVVAVRLKRNCTLFSAAAR